MEMNAYICIYLLVNQTQSFTFGVQVSYCACKSSCATKRKENSSRGCPCKGKNIECSVDCKCGNRNKPCKNRVCLTMKMYLLFLCSYFILILLSGNILWLQGNAEENRVRGSKKARKEGFCGLTQSNVNVETEDQQREKEHTDVKVFVFRVTVLTMYSSHMQNCYRELQSFQVETNSFNSNAVCYNEMK